MTSAEKPRQRSGLPLAKPEQLGNLALTKQQLALCLFNVFGPNLAPAQARRSATARSTTAPVWRCLCLASSAPPSEKFYPPQFGLTSLVSGLGSQVPDLGSQVSIPRSQASGLTAEAERAWLHKGSKMVQVERHGQRRNVIRTQQGWSKLCARPWAPRAPPAFGARPLAAEGGLCLARKRLLGHPPNPSSGRRRTI